MVEKLYDFNSAKIKEANNDLEKKLHKLLNDSNNQIILANNYIQHVHSLFCYKIKKNTCFLVEI